MSRPWRVLALALLLALGAAGCGDGEWEAGEPQVVAGTEEERRVLERKEKAESAAGSMVFVLFLVIPMGLAAAAIAVSHRNDP